MKELPIDTDKGWQRPYTLTDREGMPPIYKCPLLRENTKGMQSVEPWSSGYGRRLTSKRLWVRIPAPDTRLTFFTFYCFKDIVMFV